MASTKPAADVGRYLLSCAECGADLGPISGAAGTTGRSTCPRCGWWVDWQFIWDPDYTVPIPEFFNWSGAEG